MKRTRIVVLALLLIACGSAKVPNVSINDLIPLDKAVLSADDAARALVILQDFRISTIRTLKNTAPEKITPEFRELDKTFRNRWSDAHKVVSEWRLKGEGQENFKITYRELLDLALRYAQVQ